MVSRQQKIGLLSRINRGKVVMPSFLTSLSRALECAVERDALQSLPETDLLWKIYSEGYGQAVVGAESSYRYMFSETEAANIFPVLECLSFSLQGETAFLLTKQSEICGAVEIDVSNLLRHWKSMISLDGDSVMLVSKDRMQGFLIDFNPDDRHWHYEIAVWGTRWTSLIEACNRS